MGILSSILGKIFPHRNETTAQAPATPGTPATPTATAGAVAPAAPIPVVDLEQVLSGLAAKNPEKLNWRTSIVDLMKLLGLDSSLTARKELAKELNYSGDTSDSATMNIWLHKQVLAKVAANGGKVPADLL